MTPDEILNLFRDLLRDLPEYAKWGLLTFAGVFILREAIALGWNRYHRRRLGNLNEAGLPQDAASSEQLINGGLPGLPAPDPFQEPMQSAKLENVELHTPPSGAAR